MIRGNALVPVRQVRRNTQRARSTVMHPLHPL